MVELLLSAQTSPPNGLTKSWEPYEDRDSRGGPETTGEEAGIVCISSPLPIAAPFTWQNHHPLFLLAALLQAVCAKNHHFSLSSCFDRDFFLSLFK